MQVSRGTQWQTWLINISNSHYLVGLGVSCGQVQELKEEILNNECPNTVRERSSKDNAF